MVDVISRQMCTSVAWTEVGITFEYYGPDAAFILSQHILFENKDHVVVGCRFTRQMPDFVLWVVETHELR